MEIVLQGAGVEVQEEALEEALVQDALEEVLVQDALEEVQGEALEELSGVGQLQEWLECPCQKRWSSALRDSG